MGWDERLREAAYTSPEGDRIVFLFENVSEQIDKKTSAYNFPNLDGTYVQDMGKTGRRFPMRIFFSGPDYDLQSDAFFEILGQTGTGKLEHPSYGVFDVVPFGTIKRRDDLKTAANQSIFEFTLWSTIGLVFLSGQDDAPAQVLSSVDQYNEALASELNDNVDFNNVTNKTLFENTFQTLTNATEAILQPIADVQEEVKRQFESINKSINQGIDVLIGDPLALAFNTSILIQAPARALALIKDRLDAYSNLAASIIQTSSTESSESQPIAPEPSQVSNDFFLRNTFVSTAVTGSVISAINNTFITQVEAIEAAESILEQFDSVVLWKDDSYQEIEQIDTGSSYQKLLESVALISGYLVSSSFNLRKEYRIVTDRNRTIIDLCGEYYQEIDEQLDFFINTNNLSGSEIIEIKEGTEIVYYI